MHSAPKSRGKKGMGKDDFMKMQPQLQTVLRVNMQCQCEGCRSKIRSVLKKIKGVETCKVDLEQGKVTVIGEVDPAKLIEKLSQKTDKHVELWGFPKAMNINNLNNNNNNQMKNIHVAEIGRGGKGGMNPPQKKGEEMMNLHQMFPKPALDGQGGPPQFKDMKMMMPPSKDQKSVKFQMPANDDFNDEDDSDYEFDEDDLSDDESDDGHDEGGGAMSVGGGKKKGFKLSNVPLLKRLGSKKEEKSETDGGNKKGDKFLIEKQGGGKNNAKKGANSLEQVKSDGKNGGNGNNIGGGGGGGGGKNMKEGQKDGGGQAMNNAQNNLGSDFPRNMSQTGRNIVSGPGPSPYPGQGQMGFGANPKGNMGGMRNYPMGEQMGNFQTTQGLPLAGMSGGGAQYPPGMAAGYDNPYNNQQQQYMAMMMNQKQQQQQQPSYGNGMYNSNNPMMMYGRPMNYGPPPTPPHAMDNHFTHYFNDENTNSCSIM